MISSAVLFSVQFAKVLSILIYNMFIRVKGMFSVENYTILFCFSFEFCQKF